MLLNKQRAWKLMEKYGFDALIASTPQNVVYASDFHSRAQWIGYYGSQIYVVLPRKKETEPAIITPVIGGGLYPSSFFPSWIKDIRSYGVPPYTVTAELKMIEPKFESKFYGVKADVTEVLAKSLEDKGISNKTIGFDELSIFLLERLKKELPKARLIMANRVFRELRMVKTEEEILRLAKVVKITEKSLRAAIEALSPGVIIRDVAQILKRVVVEEGGVPLSLTARGGDNLSAGDYKLKKNDIVWFDSINTYQSYLSDMGRTAVLGSPSDKLKKYHRATLRGQEEALKAIMPGVKASEIFNIAVETVRKEGIHHYQRGACGHGIGTEFDLPIIGPRDHTPLEENMVLCIETPYREMGFGGFMLEDTVVVTKGGIRFLSTMDRHLYII